MARFFLLLTIFLLSYLFQKDQIEYKKLNNKLAEKKVLFKRQTDEIKTLQNKLQAALREKANTKRAHTKIHSSVRFHEINV